MSIDDNNGKTGQGFSGLNSLVSDISTDIDEPSPELSKNRAANLSGIFSQNTSKDHEGQDSPTKSRAYASTSGSKDSSYLIKICYAVICIIFICVLVNKCSTPTTTTVDGSSSNNWRQKVSIEKPPVGNNLLLNARQIRYCLADKIRIESIRSIITGASESTVNKFNFLVDDHNSRCSQFRYRNKELEHARQEIEQYRSQIAAAALDEWTYKLNRQ